MSDEAVLLLRLEGPLQSWGERSRWDVRDTADIPTKSGVLGLVATAFGWPRGDRRIVELQEELLFGVRVDRRGSRLVDFQTVTGDLPSADGKSKGTGVGDYTVISPRAYLQDASFLVGLLGKRSTLERCQHALHRPRWPYYLGRKSCPPSVPVVVELVEGCSLQSALDNGVAKLEAYFEDAQGDIQVRDRNLGTPAREYGLTSYRYHTYEGPSGTEAANVS